LIGLIFSKVKNDIWKKNEKKICIILKLTITNKAKKNNEINGKELRRNKSTTREAEMWWAGQ
jgi:hypothetical protein